MGTSISVNATVVGQCSATNSTEDLVYLENSINIYKNRIAIIKFITPKFSGVAVSIDIELSVSFFFMGAGGYDSFIKNLNIALCENDSNYKLYFSKPVSDPYQITTTTVRVESSKTLLSIPTSHIESEREYYLILWPVINNNEASFVFNETKNYSINVNYVEGLVHINSGSGFDSYQVFIDNGTSWDLVIPYNDNGTSWILLS